MKPYWKPIETAPKDRRIMLRYDVEKYRKDTVVFGQWSSESNAARRKPYWSNDLEYLYGKLDTRERQPTHWDEIPSSEIDA